MNRIEYAFGNDTPIVNEPFIADPNRLYMLFVIETDQAGDQQTIPTTIGIGPEKIYLPLMWR